MLPTKWEQLQLLCGILAVGRTIRSKSYMPAMFNYHMEYVRTQESQHDLRLYPPEFLVRQVPTVCGNCHSYVHPYDGYILHACALCQQTGGQHWQWLAHDISRECDIHTRWVELALNIAIRNINRSHINYG